MAWDKTPGAPPPVEPAGGTAQYDPGSLTVVDVGNLGLEPGLGRTWQARWRGLYGAALPTSAVLLLRDVRTSEMPVGHFCLLVPG